MLLSNRGLLDGGTGGRVCCVVVFVLPISSFIYLDLFLFGQYLLRVPLTSLSRPIAPALLALPP